MEEEVREAAAGGEGSVAAGGHGDIPGGGGDDLEDGLRQGPRQTHAEDQRQVALR